MEIQSNTATSNTSEVEVIDTVKMIRIFRTELLGKFVISVSSSHYTSLQRRVLAKKSVGTSQRKSRVSFSEDLLKDCLTYIR
jgi:hypothetical protein